MRKLILTITFLSICFPVQANEIITIAQSQIGQGEQGGDNRGPIIRKYTQGKEVAWCAAFVSWTLRSAGRNVPYFLSAKSFWNKADSYGATRHASPRAGDLIVFYRGSPRGKLGHVGIVESVTGSRITTIEGNVGKYPAKVKRFEYDINNIPNLIGFVRI